MPVGDLNNQRQRMCSAESCNFIRAERHKRLIDEDNSDLGILCRFFKQSVNLIFIFGNCALDACKPQTESRVFIVTNQIKTHNFTLDLVKDKN